MAQVRLYHDCRTATDNEPASIRVRVSVDNAQTMISTGIKVRPDQWDKVQNQVVKHPQNIELTMQLRSICQNISDAIGELQQEDKLRRITSNKELRIAIENIVFPDRRKVIINLPEGQIKINGNLNERFGAQYLAFAATHKPSTRRTYMLTWRHICRFLSRTNPNGEEAAMRLPFEKIDHRWLRSFENYLAETAPSQNARSVKLRNIRAAFNEAINNNVTAAYPFRRYKVKTTATRKRSLTVEQLRQLFTMPVEPTAEKFRDIFKLTFLLCGINMIDLCNLREIINGRIEYRRSKTGKLYSIKVEPEAMEMIEKYRGTNYLLFPLDHYTDHLGFLSKINKALRKLGPVERHGLGGKKYYEPLFPHLSTYWARHSWATIAASLDIPKEIIAHGLGHGSNSVTDIYIDFDQSKVDRANRRIIDYVLYGKGRPLI